ncbi:hypothetical protein AAF712_015354 [Marasmius tenuissimus]|uniref:Uncharacterized protein n=1 Tax=Marasmius tenuissimus TaxID=585030 RepID=A0ABR2Z9S3_9AGAR
MSSFCDLPYFHKTIYTFLERRFSPHGRGQHHQARNDAQSPQARITQYRSWSNVDLNVIQRYSKLLDCPDLYSLKAFRWIVEEFRDSLSLIPHVQEVLRSKPAHLVMPAVFDRDMVPLGRDWTYRDVGHTFVRGDFEQLSINPTSKFQYTLPELQLLYYHHLWITGHMIVSGPPLFAWNASRTISPKMLHAPFSRIARLLETARPNDFELAVTYLVRLRSHWREICTTQEDALDVITQVHRWVQHQRIEKLFQDEELRHLDLSPLPRFLSFINDEIIAGSFFQMQLPSIQPYVWIDALEGVRVALNLPAGYFREHKGFFPFSSNLLDRLIRDPHSSAETHNSLERWLMGFDDAPVQEKQAMLYSFTLLILTHIPNDQWPAHLRDQRRDWTSIPNQQQKLDNNSFLSSPTGYQFLADLNVRVAISGLNLSDDHVQTHFWNLAWEVIQHIHSTPDEESKIESRDDPVQLFIPDSPDA